MSAASIDVCLNLLRRGSITTIAMETPDEPDSGHLPIGYSVVGVQKAATSTLHNLLIRHRNVARPPRKELHFFDDNRRNWQRPDYSTYRVRRTRPWQRIAGDATPIYLMWPHALERMWRYNQQMRLIASFRDPIERAYSHWAMQASRSDGFPSFDEVVAEWHVPTAPDAVPPGWSATQLRTHSVVPRGFYGAQLDRGLDIFPREQWLLLDFETVRRDQRRVCDELTGFLGLPDFKAYPHTQVRHRADRESPPPSPSAQTVARLVDTYADDLQRFAAISGFDLAEWPTWQLVAGTLTPAELARSLGAATPRGSGRP